MKGKNQARDIKEGKFIEGSSKNPSKRIKRHENDRNKLPFLAACPEPYIHVRFIHWLTINLHWHIHNI
jgi:hypothetical protein